MSPPAILAATEPRLASESLAASATPPRVAVWPGLLLAAGGAIAFAGKAIVAKLMYRHGVDAVQVLFWRMALAAPLFMLIAWWSGRGKPRLTRRETGVVVALGFCGYYLASFLDFLGLQYISASLERLILYLNPALVLLLGWLLFGRRAGWRQGVAMAVGYLGVLLVFGQELSMEGAHVALGAALVFGSALSYSLYMVGSGEAVKRLGSLRLTGLASTVACFFCIVQLPLLRPLAAAVVPAPVLWLSLLNATVCTVAPIVMVMMAIERIGPTLTAQVGMIGPLSTIGMGVVLLGEPFTPWLAAGTVLVMLGVGLLARWR